MLCNLSPFLSSKPQKHFKLIAMPLFHFSGLFLFIGVPILLLIAYYIKTKNRERMQMIEKGINPDEGLNVTDYKKYSSLKNGILFLFFGLGLLVGQLLVIFVDEIDKFFAHLIMLLIFGGIGFLINFMIIQKLHRK